MNKPRRRPATVDDWPDVAGLAPCRCRASLAALPSAQGLPLVIPSAALPVPLVSLPPRCPVRLCRAGLRAMPPRCRQGVRVAVRPYELPPRPVRLANGCAGLAGDPVRRRRGFPCI